MRQRHRLCRQLHLQLTAVRRQRRRLLQRQRVAAAQLLRPLQPPRQTQRRSNKTPLPQPPRRQRLSLARLARHVVQTVVSQQSTAVKGRWVLKTLQAGTLLCIEELALTSFSCRVLFLMCVTVARMTDTTL